MTPGCGCRAGRIGLVAAIVAYALAFPLVDRLPGRPVLWFLAIVVAGAGGDKAAGMGHARIRRF